MMTPSTMAIWVLQGARETSALVFERVKTEREGARAKEENAPFREELAAEKEEREERHEEADRDALEERVVVARSRCRTPRKSSSQVSVRR